MEKELPVRRDSTDIPGKREKELLDILMQHSQTATEKELSESVSTVERKDADQPLLLGEGKKGIEGLTMIDEEKFDLKRTAFLNRKGRCQCVRALFDPNTRIFRMMLLLLLCATAFGHMFNYDRFELFLFFPLTSCLQLKPFI